MEIQACWVRWPRLLRQKQKACEGGDSRARLWTCEGRRAWRHPGGRQPFCLVCFTPREREQLPVPGLESSSGSHPHTGSPRPGMRSPRGVGRDSRAQDKARGTGTLRDLRRELPGSSAVFNNRGIITECSSVRRWDRSRSPRTSSTTRFQSKWGESLLST